MKPTWIVTLLMVFLAGCASQPGQQSDATPSPAGMSAGDAAVKLIEQDMQFKLTQQAVDNARIEQAARMTATQQVVDALATSEAQRVSISATNQAWQVTVQAAQSHETATAAAQATSTQQANERATQQVYQSGTATADWKTQQAPIISAQQTAVAAQALSADLAAQRARMTNGVLAWGPWLIAALAISVAAFVIIRKSQVGTIQPDENGLMPGVVIFHNGQKQLILPDRMFSPVLTLDQQGVSAPALTDPERQEGTTRRAQAVQAINALPPMQQQRGTSLMNQIFNPVQARPGIEFVENGQISGWIEEAENKLGQEL